MKRPPFVQVFGTEHALYGVANDGGVYMYMHRFGSEACGGWARLRDDLIEVCDAAISSRSDSDGHTSRTGCILPVFHAGHCSAVPPAAGR